MGLGLGVGGGAEGREDELEREGEWDEDEADGVAGGAEAVGLGCTRGAARVERLGEEGPLRHGQPDGGRHLAPERAARRDAVRHLVRG